LGGGHTPRRKPLMLSNLQDAGVVKLVDTRDLKSLSFFRVLVQLQ
jgi:hypothetical protein